MPPALVAAIPALLSTAASFYSIEKSTGNPNNANPNNIYPPPSTTPTTPATTTPGLTTDPNAQAAITARLAQLQSQAGPAGFSPQFYTTALDSQYPGFDQMVQQIVSQKVGG